MIPVLFILSIVAGAAGGWWWLAAAACWIIAAVRATHVIRLERRHIEYPSQLRHRQLEHITRTDRIR